MTNLNIATLKKYELFLSGALNRLTYNLHPVSHVFGDLTNAVDKVLAMVSTEKERCEIVALAPIKCRLRKDAIRRVVFALETVRERLAAAELIDQLIVEEATTPEAKRFVKQHGESAFEDWQHHRAILADAAADIYRWAICDCCEGSGKVGHPAFSNGITSSEWADMDQDGRDSYMRGDYEVQCDCCKGSGKVKLPEVSRMGWPLKRELVRQRQHNRIMAQLAREEAAERRMGA